MTVRCSGIPAKRLLKMVVFGASLVLASPLILAAWLENKLSTTEAVFVGLGQLLALIPGLVGIYLRGAYYYATLDRCSWETHIWFGSVFTHRGAALGRNVSMGAYCVIGHADIGDDVMMASRVSIPSGKRQHFDDAGRLSSEARYERVMVGGKCWVGEGAIIMADLGNCCIVSAGAVVVRSMPSAVLVGGNPARVLKELGVDSVDPAAE